jgi:hypothetical protein
MDPAKKDINSTFAACNFYDRIIGGAAYIGKNGH